MIELTEKACQEIQRVMTEQNMTSEDFALRVGVTAGGCAGFSYALGFEKKTEGNELNDTTYQFGNITAKVDRKSEMYIDGTTIDFHSGIEKRGFVFNNPLSQKGCGCGKSFA